jgi:hypothetical protein
MARRLRCILAPPFHHRWVRVVNDGWAYARCVRCSKERELDDAFIKSLGENPPPLYPPLGTP